MNKFYITIIDPKGGVYMGDNSDVAISYRILCENGSMYGYEPFVKKFNSQQELLLFLRMIAENESGTYDRFTWERK